jgi:hypothetical protein
VCAAANMGLILIAVAEMSIKESLNDLKKRP